VNDIKARVITSAGKIINIVSSSIKDEVIEGTRFKFFAMEGLEKNSEIEFSYVTKRNPTFFGSETFQGKSTPYAKVNVSIVVPKHLKFEAAGFNGFKVLKDSVIGDERVIACYAENIKELDDEKYGLREPNLQRLDFKLSYNLSGNRSDVKLYTWNEMSRNIYGNLTNYTEKEKKAIAKFIKAANFPDNVTEEKTIQLLEDYMKTRINIDDKLISEDAENIEAIIKTGNSNNFGASRFFIAMLENKAIPYQVVFPSVRDQLPLVENLENWNRIDELLIFFPSTRKYLQPSGNTLRYPYVEPYWTGTRGLFLKITSIGDMKTVVAKFDSIAMEPFDQHAHNMEVSAKLNESGDSLFINSKQIFKGYGSIYYRPIWAYLTGDKQDEAVKDIISSVAKSENIQNIKVENTNFTDLWDNKPLMVSGTIQTAELLDKAGKKILFKIGELIGPQEQMYQEKPRQLPVELQYPHILERVIRFRVPDGYFIKNVNDLNSSIEIKEGENVVLGFRSSYTLNGSDLVVDVLETYRLLKYPMSQFETFKKVINAAADFNKIVLVLEKK
ncbi:MAG TPA: DUF3857 domain-containing protein, partial [Ferruginibacter sp.]|nr:DUF3857 domain-containing protein [Ferruginibacter sp.]